MSDSKLTTREIIDSLKICGSSGTCTGCAFYHEDSICTTTRLKKVAAARLEELETVKQNFDVSQETSKTQERLLEKSEKTTDSITMPLVEYAYLQSLDMLLDILLGAGDYSTFRNVFALRDIIREMKQERMAVIEK